MIKRRMDTEAARKFWASFPKYNKDDDDIVLPSLGAWDLDIEKELSPELLGKTWKELTK